MILSQDKKIRQIFSEKNFLQKVLVGQIAVRGTVTVNFRNFLFENNIQFHEKFGDFLSCDKIFETCISSNRCYEMFWCNLQCDREQAPER